MHLTDFFGQFYTPFFQFLICHRKNTEVKTHWPVLKNTKLWVFLFVCGKFFPAESVLFPSN